MASPRPQIPVRISSKPALEQRTLQLQSSRQDLKRKLSSTSYNESPIYYHKLKIEALNLEVEEHTNKKSWLDIEHEEHKLDVKDYRYSHRKTNERTISLGDELWKQRQGLQQEEEKAGQAPAMGPDSRQPFIHTLLALYKDPTVSSKRSSSEQKEMRTSAIRVYESAKGAPKGRLWCPISQDYFDFIDMKAAHIVPRRLGPSLVDYIFGEGSGSRLNTADNCLMLERRVERGFDNGNFVLLPAEPTESPIKTWKIQITNLSAKNSDLGRTTLSQMNGKTLVFRNENRPAARFLYFHFVITLLRNKRDRVPGWERFCVELPTHRPFAMPGHYLRQSMLLVLVKGAGDLNSEEEARLLGEAGQETFERDEQLDAGIELEIGRRALISYERPIDEHGFEEDDDDDDDEDDDEFQGD